MKKHVVFLLILSIGVLLCACSDPVSDANKSVAPAEAERTFTSPIDQKAAPSLEEPLTTPNAPSGEPQIWESESRNEASETQTQTEQPSEPQITPSGSAPEPANSPQEPEPPTAEEAPDLSAGPETLLLRINGTVLDVQWEENETVAELLAYVQNENIVVNTTIYGGFEQVGSLPQAFSRNDVQMTTSAGDIVLYSGNQLVVFFDSNTWSYTKLGHIDGLSLEDLTTLLDHETATFELSAK